MTEQNVTSGAALAGLRVVELGESVAPAFAGRWLAAFGATVTKIEPPDGSWTRRYSPLGEPVTGDTGPLTAFLDAGKESVVLDAASGGDRDTLAGLVADADLLLHDLSPARLTAWGLDLAPARAEGLVEVALTPFGSEGPYAGYAATAITLLALGGFQYLSGQPGRPPLMLPGFQPEYLTAFYGIVTGLAGVLARLPGEAGRRFEVPVHEALASLHQFTTSQWLYGGSIRSRHGNRWENLYPITMLPCRDGYVACSMPGPEMWERLCLMIERPDLLADPRFATPALRRQHADDLDAVLLPWLSERTMAEIVTLAQETWRLPVNSYVEVAGVLHDPQYVTRGFWVAPEGDTSGVLHPGIPVLMERTPWRIRRAPHLGESGGLESGDRSRMSRRQRTGFAGQERRASETPDPALPLAGLRVLDFTRVWSGPLGTRILADLGAEVIKIEPPFARNAPAPGGTPGDATEIEARPVAGMGKLNRNKLSLAVDLRRPEGQDLIKRLAAHADLLAENFSARVMPNLGLSFATLRERNPGLIYLAMSGYGVTGPYREYLGYGSATEATTGLTALLGYPGEEPLNTAIAYPDPLGGLAGVSAAMAALVYRARTGEGQFIDLSQLEPASLALGEFFIAAQEAGRAPERMGNTHPEWSPHGTYRCLGEDEWLSLAVRSDAEWSAFCAAAGLADLAADTALATAAGRREQRQRLDAAIEAWTATGDKFALMETLQRAGIPAGAVVNARELVENPHLASRNFMVNAVAPEGGDFPMPGTPVTVDGRKRAVFHAAPRRGEHSREILARVLGMAAGEIDALVQSGVVVDPATVSV